ncbi:MAG: hypothetical protein IJ776_05415 [Paludibacteraceae bacterium]|nr:hypothetical protein [Paludibacteraceae bacterium]
MCSCERVDDAIEHAGELNFGKAEYIRGWWLGLKPQNPLLTDTIYFDYENLDAGSPVVFEIVSQDGTLMNNADLCVLSESETGIDTVWCKDNCFTIVPPQESVVIGLRFKDEERSDNYGWTLRVKEKGDIERMVFPEGNVSTSDDPNPAVLTFKAQLDKHLNTPRTVTDVVLTLVVVGFLLWILLLRYLFFDRFKTKRLIIEDKDSEHRVEIRGALSLCLTANRQKQSVWERIFVGKRLFYVNDFFEDGDILVTPRNRNTVRLKAPDGYNMSQYTISKNEEVPLKVYNIKNEEVELQIV